MYTTKYVNNIKDWHAIIFLIVIILLYFVYLETLFPHYFLFDDNVNAFLQIYSYNWKSIIQYNTIPFINFHQYLGHAYYAQGATSVFYIPVYLCSLISFIMSGNILSVIDILAITHLIISAIGLYLLLRRYKLSILSSILCSLLWISFPYLTIVTRSWIIFSYTLAFLPWNFFFLDKLIKSPCFKYWLYFIFLKILYFYNGHVQFLLIICFFEFLFLSVYFLFNTKKTYDQQSNNIYRNIKHYLTTNTSNILRIIKIYTLSILSFLLLAAPLLLPMYVHQKESFYRSSKLPFHDFINHSLDIIDFIKSQFFIFRENVIFGSDSEIFFVGLPVLLTLGFIFFKKARTNKLPVIFLILALTAFIMSTDSYSYFYYLPILNKFRWPFKYYFLFLFFATLTIAMLINSVESINKSIIKMFIYFLIIINIIMNVYVLFSNSSPSDVFNRSTITKFDNKLSINDNITTTGRIFTLWLKNPNPNDIYKFYTYNYATLLNLYHFGGYDVLRSKQIAQLTLGLDHSNIYKGNFSQALLNYLSSWSVKYLVTQNNELGRKLSGFQQLKLIKSDEEKLVYENIYALPIVYYFDQDPEKFRYYINKHLKYDIGINEIIVYPNNKDDRNIVINVAPLKWYKIYIDNKDKGYIDQDKLPLTIKVPKNTKVVTIAYEDRLFYLGLILFGICLIFILCIILKFETSINRIIFR